MNHATLSHSITLVMYKPLLSHLRLLKQLSESGVLVELVEMDIPMTTTMVVPVVTLNNALQLLQVFSSLLLSAKAENKQDLTVVTADGQTVVTVLKVTLLDQVAEDLLVSL
jgi:hypothetical protein